MQDFGENSNDLDLAIYLPREILTRDQFGFHVNSICNIFKPFIMTIYASCVVQLFILNGVTNTLNIGRIRTFAHTEHTELTEGQ